MTLAFCQVIDSVHILSDFSVSQLPDFVGKKLIKQLFPASRTVHHYQICINRRKSFHSVIIFSSCIWKWEILCTRSQRFRARNVSHAKYGNGETQLLAIFPKEVLFDFESLSSICRFLFWFAHCRMQCMIL